MYFNVNIIIYPCHKIFRLTTWRRRSLPTLVQTKAYCHYPLNQYSVKKSLIIRSVLPCGADNNAYLETYFLQLKISSTPSIETHDDVIKWKHFPRYWPFVGEIHRWPVNSPHKGRWRGTFDVFFDLCLNKRPSKQSWGWWFETPSRSLRRHCNISCLLHIN